MTPNDADSTRNTEVAHPQTQALARMVHAAWRDGMLAQGREVPTKRLRWESLSKQDQALDCCIAEQMALVLATQNLPFLPASYTMPTFSEGELRLFAQAGQARGQSLARVDQQSGVLMLGLGYGMAQLLATAQAQAEELTRLQGVEVAARKLLGVHDEFNQFDVQDALASADPEGLTPYSHDDDRAEAGERLDIAERDLRSALAQPAEAGDQA